MEAEEALARATDGAVRAALTRVAADEARHAALAWRFIQWVMGEGPAGLRRTAVEALGTIVDAEITAALAKRPARAVARDPSRVAHGMLDDWTRWEVRLAVLNQIVAPCAEALRLAHGPEPGPDFPVISVMQRGTAVV
jgi:hypothetical protein